MSHIPVIFLSVILLMIPLGLTAQEPERHEEEKIVELDKFAIASSDVGAPKTLHLRTNLLYDFALLPNVGIEFSLGGQWSLLAEGSVIWAATDPTHRYWRIALAGLEARYWTQSKISAMRHRGHHLGLYATALRYDLEFGGRGQLAEINYGGGFAYGYSVPIGRSLSLDFGLALGYIHGKYLEYVPIDSHYVWQGNKTRNYFGPIKAEISLVWHIELKKKDGEEW
ncbi:MAG: DUF3575 domain-containing protein [Bacteroidales bacterium]|nr:DUF3575 domain-containing protein [Bacteroidales bacterium]